LLGRTALHLCAVIAWSTVTTGDSAADVSGSMQVYSVISVLRYELAGDFEKTVIVIKYDDLETGRLRFDSDRLVRAGCRNHGTYCPIST
jgi:hypothetical protein